jgi:hypothetical protein
MINTDTDLLNDYGIRVIHMGWYTPATWRELRAIPEAGIELSYSAFVRKCERRIPDYIAQGFRVEKVPVDIGQMKAWCGKHGYALDAKGRAAFGAALVTARESGEDITTLPVEDNTRLVQCWRSVSSHALHRRTSSTQPKPIAGGPFMIAASDVFQKTFKVQQIWRAFHLEVTDALRAAGAKSEYLGTDSIGTCPAIDRAMRDCEFASSDYDSPADFDRAEFLCKVVVRMIERERQKFRSDPKTWLSRHWAELIAPPVEKPRRRYEYDEA